MVIRSEITVRLLIKTFETIDSQIYLYLAFEEASDDSLDRMIPAFSGSPRLLSWYNLDSDRAFTFVRMQPNPNEVQYRKHKDGQETDPKFCDNESDDEVHFDNDLIFACEVGNDNLVEKLIRKGVDVNSRDSIGRTPLHFAVQNNSIPVIALLLNAGADATIMDDVGLTPLTTCLMRKPSVEIARLLFDHGANLPPVSPVSPGLFLQFSMMCIPTPEEAKLLSLLIEKGALINDPDVPGGRSALHFAAMSNNCELINVLVSLGADLFATNHRGETPFDVAVAFHCKSAMECLRQYSTSSTYKHAGMI